MKPRTLLVLLILVLGLGAFIWFYERDLPSSEERAEQSRKVLQLEKDAVTAVTIESAAGPVHLQRVDPPKPPEEKEEKKEGEEGETPDAEDLAPPAPDAEWRITRPLAARADYAAIDGLLSALTGLEKSRTLEDAAAADVGLDKPQATVRLATADGETVLKIGAAVPTGGAVIVGVEGIEGDDRVYVVPDSILGELQKAPGDWRDRQMFHARRDEIEGIRLTGPSGQVMLTQLGERFRIASPIRDLADREKADSLYADLSGLTAERFVDAPERPLAELGLEPPRAAVDVAVRGKAPVRVELGAPVDPAAAPPDPAADTGEQLVHARIGKQVFETRTRLAATAALPAADWRSLSLTSFDVYSVDSATVQDGQGSLALKRAGTDWKRGEETISYVGVSDLLFAVTGARADRLVPGSLVPGRPVLTMTLKPSQGAGETLSFFAPGPAGAPVRTSGREVALLIPAAKLQEIQKSLAEVRKAKPLSADEKKEGE